MFTGIITETGKIKAIQRKRESLLLLVAGTDTAAGAAIGDSVAVNGVCLTVTRIDGAVLSMDVGEETFDKTTLSELKISDSVNLEPSVRLGGKMGGHIVTGHVDAVGRLESVIPKTTETVIYVRFPPELERFIAPKGSIAVDGISLTVGEIEDCVFTLHIIPHSFEKTTLGNKRTGSRVNLEIDVLARYVVNAIGGQGGEQGGLLEKLQKFGYLGTVRNV